MDAWLPILWIVKVICLRVCAHSVSVEALLVAGAVDRALPRGVHHCSVGLVLLL